MFKRKVRFKARVCYFISKCYFSPNDSPSNTMKNVFLFHFKKLFSFARYVDFYISVFPLFTPVSHCFRGWSKINLKAYYVINCLNKNLITHVFDISRREKGMWTLSIDRVLNKEHFMEKSHQKWAPKASPRPLFILVNNQKQPLHVRSYFKNKIFWKRIIKKP